MLIILMKTNSKNMWEKKQENFECKNNFFN